MPVLKDFNQFDGLHWETGSVHNFYAYRGVRAPHTGRPYSEAMLMGISGGAVMGYFSFAYQGYDPQARILTRNTFNPLDTLLERLGVVQNIMQTNSPSTGVANLVHTLAEGLPAITWVDLFSLPYNNFPQDAGMWAMMPVVVYGYDEAANRVWIADRARLPLEITPGELAAARGRTKANRYRLLTLDPPIADKLPAAIKKGIWDCIKLYTEAPPKGSRNNFGFAAYRWWADLLVKPGLRMSWEHEFPRGAKMFAGLTSVFTDVMTFGKDGSAERDVYARFLDEASQVLDRPALQQAAELFRASGKAWNTLADALLPDEFPLLSETRQLMLRRHRQFLDQGGAALPDIRQIDRRLHEIQTAAAADFPLTPSQVGDMRHNLRAHVMKIHDIEVEAIGALQKAII